MAAQAAPPTTALICRPEESRSRGYEASGRASPRARQSPATVVVDPEEADLDILDRELVRPKPSIESESRVRLNEANLSVGAIECSGQRDRYGHPDCNSPSFLERP